jgi:hypothetical protein
VNIQSYSAELTVDLRDINGVSVFSKTLLPANELSEFNLLLSSHSDGNTKPSNRQAREPDERQHRRFCQTRGEPLAQGFAGSGPCREHERIRDAEEQVGDRGKNARERQGTHQCQPAFTGANRKRNPEKHGQSADEQSEAPGQADESKGFHGDPPAPYCGDASGV